MNIVKLREEDIHLSGEFPALNSIAPDFELVTSTLQLKSLKQYGNKRKLLSIVPSIDTHICAISARRFNSLASEYPEYSFIVISADLPFAMARFKKSEKLKNIDLLSIFRAPDFADNYGVLMVDGALQGLTARAILVLDEDNSVLYTELVGDISSEPDYDAALVALKR
jgi:thioredoxin-dependent peroxiredoxin